MSLAAVFLFAVGAVAVVGVGVLVHMVLAGDHASLNLTAVWIVAVWAVLSMVAAAWCRVQAVRADAVEVTKSVPASGDDASGALMKGFEQWMNDEKAPQAPTSSSSSME